MPVIYRQIRPSRLSEAQRAAKLKRDAAYEIAVQNLSTPFYAKKHSQGVTPEEQVGYNKAKANLWEAYKTWAISQGLYEEVTPEQQLTEAEASLSDRLADVNDLGTELGLPLIQTAEVV